MFFLALSLISCLLAPVFAEDLVKVLQPASLVEQFQNGLVEHSSALFGVPPPGRSMVGEVLYAPASDIDGCQPLNTSFLAGYEGHVVFIIVDRGSCTFVEKVRHVQEIGGHAAIIADNVDEDFLPFMADDGTGGDVNIPSVLISHQDGLRIKEALATEQVQFKMTWNIPNPDGRVEWMMWTTPVDEASVAFKNTFGTVVSSLGASAQFTPHYIVLDGEYNGCTTVYDCGNQCTNNGRYCNYDPDDDEAVGLSGADVVQESLRQICFFKTVNESGADPELWWEYTRKFEKKCNSPDFFNEDCSYSIVAELGVSVDDVQKCISDSGGYGMDTDADNTLLQAEIDAERAYGIRWWPMLFINNSPYYEALTCPNPLDVTTCGPLNMICGGYAPDTSPCTCNPTLGCDLCEQPDACGTCLDPNSPDFQFDKSQCASNAPTEAPAEDKYSDVNPVNVGAVIGIVLVCCAIVAAGLYWHFSRKQAKMRGDIDQLLAQYQPMEAPSDSQLNAAFMNQSAVPLSDTALPETTVHP